MNTLTESSICRFRFSELAVKPDDIGVLLGFAPGEFPEPFGQYIDEVFQIAHNLDNICGSYVLYDKVSFDTEQNTTTLNDVIFRTGKIVTRQLRKSTSAAIFVCTAGHELESFSKQQIKSGNIPEGYIADIAGSVIVEAAMDKIQQKIAVEMESLGFGITNRYSPGYCGWNVAEQQKLFMLLPRGTCNISLSESSLMQPIKSVSGIVGIGKDVKTHPYTCQICDMKECIYRNRKHH